MPRVRFTVRRLMLAVAIVAVPLALIAALVRPASSAWIPRDAAEALAHATRAARTRHLKHPLEDYDAEVRRIRVDGTVDGQMHGGLFEVCFIKRDLGGVEVDRDCFVITPGGYCMARTTISLPDGAVFRPD